MPIIATQTREDLRVSIGRILGAVKLITGAAAGTTTTLLTDGLATGAATDFNGKWLVFTSGANNDGLIRQVISSTVAANRVTLTFFPAVTDATASTDTVELWDEAYDPVNIHEFIQQAVLDATTRIFDPVETKVADVNLCGDGITARFDIPTDYEMVRDVYVREQVASVQIHDCDTAWDEQTVLANVTRSVDTEDKKTGGGSVRFVFTAAAATGIVSSKAITSLDLRKYTHFEGWAKSTVLTVAGDLRILLDDTANVASVLENLLIPVLTADTWRYFRLAFDTPELDSAIISVGLRHQVDIGAATVWLDDLKAVDNNSAVWVAVPRHLWTIDKEARALVLVNGGVAWVGSRLLKLVGGDNPLLLNADSDTNEVPDSYVIYRSVGLAMLTRLDMQARAQMFLGLAERETAKFPPLVNVRYTI